MKTYLYNSLANNGIRPEVPAGVELRDAVGLDYAAYLKGLAPEDEVVLVGGDGTLNYFINAAAPPPASAEPSATRCPAGPMSTARCA